MIDSVLDSEIHVITIDNRRDIKMTGIKDVLSFDEQTLLLDTVAGELTIKGEQLKVSGFTAETGVLTLSGTLFALAYTASSKKRNMIGRLIG